MAGPLQEISVLRNQLENKMASIVKNEMSCKTKMKRIENRMSLLKLDYNEAKAFVTQNRNQKKGHKNYQKELERMRSTMNGQAKKCTKEIERLNGQLRRCQRSGL